MSYINSQTREQIAVLAGIVTYCEAMAEDEREEFKRAKRSLQAMMRHAEKAFNAVVEDVDIDQLASIIHTTKNSQKRRDLAKCGIVTDRAGECPYQG